jgi:hypothetical protein
MQLLERSTLRIYGFVLLALFALTVAVTVTARSRRASWVQLRASAARTSSRTRARRGSALSREAVRRAAADAADRRAVRHVRPRDRLELLVVASFYDQLGRSYALAFDPTTPLQEALTRCTGRRARRDARWRPRDRARARSVNP